jgi:hypothetical protein
LKNRFPYHPDEGQGCKQAAITAFFLLVAMIPGVGRFFNNLLGVLFGFCGEKLEFLRGWRNKNHFKTTIHGFGGGCNLIAGLIFDGPKNIISSYNYCGEITLRGL